ncbi:hypothetical protein VP06_15675 [Methylobacterium aquaticum]|uniref:Uncharacterized protein n=1 Tax=Methylobacterium aquaticum TaxID=270351 RepID=A0A0J6SJJ2_9HYPH|nr:hypothetical protein VP06_15675 [Methylobacterium aquaticum]
MRGVRQRSLVLLLSPPTRDLGLDGGADEFRHVAGPGENLDFKPKRVRQPDAGQLPTDLASGHPNALANR